MNQQTFETDTQALTLVDLLRDRATGPRAHHGYTFFRGDDLDDQWLRYSELDPLAQDIARVLHETRAGRRWIERRASNDQSPPRVVILCSPGPSYLKALFGTFYSGLVAVTAYPPRARRRDPRLDRVIRDSGAEIVLADSGVMQRRDPIISMSPNLADLEWVNVDSPEVLGSDPWRRPLRDADSLALLQYTSGSTSSPKGVCLSHRNLLANLRMIYDAFEVERNVDAWSVTWLPPYHDMGLIGGLLQVMFAARCAHVLPPAAFVQKPIRWLQAIDAYRATVSGGPNFAFDTCVERIGESERTSLDLSTWSLAFTGAEPIRRRSLDRFASAFATAGFTQDSFFPCYGLAEATLIVSGGPRKRPIQVDGGSHSAGSLAAGSLAAGSLAAVPPSGLVSCGRIVSGLSVRIVDPVTGKEVAEGQSGEIWIAGDSVSRGYWMRPRETRDAFGHSLEGHRLPGNGRSYMRTGDLGFVRSGELFVSGRNKELLVLRGRNFHPRDLEEAAARCSPSLTPDSAAAFEAFDERGNAGLVILVEVERGDQANASRLQREIRQGIVEDFEIDPLQIVLIRKRSLPKTSSGKVQRLEAKRRYLDGTLLECCPEEKPGETRANEEADKVAPDAAAPMLEQGSGPSSASPAEISRWLVDRLATRLEVEPSEIDATRPFVQYGLDSVSAVQITSELEAFLGSEIQPTLFYEAPTILAASELLGRRSDRSRYRDGAAVAATATNLKGNCSDRHVAIIGMDCRLPGCLGTEEFWELLRDGRVATCDPPPGRESCVGHRSVTRRAGWIDSPEKFDASLFGISPREAKEIDPQQRLLLETCWRAVETAGIDPQRLTGSQTGVFVGISNRDYERLILRSNDRYSTYAMTGNAASMAAHRLSFHLDLHGPSVAIDTACSSSLVAVHQAIRAMQAGDCNAALVAGVNLILSPEVFEALSVSQMLSPDGICKTFDQNADGYARGEGCVAMLLKPLPQAIADGDPICAVIEGSATNQDGRTNGITAPSGESQSRLYRQALADADRHPGEISRIEAHGTGTPLGDPIEIRSLQRVYDLQVSSKTDSGIANRSDMTRAPCGNPELNPLPCCVGAVKANVGHLEAAAGLTSLMKVVLEIRNGQITPQPNLSKLNPAIDFSGSRLEVETEIRDWTRRGKRIAAVSSFGFGGTNAHVIIGEHPEGRESLAIEPDPANEQEPQLIALSALDARSLAVAADEMASFLSHSSEPLIQVAEASHQQKTSHRHRVAVVSSSRESAAKSLREVASGGTSTSIHSGIAPTDHEFSIAFLFSGQGGQHVGMGRGLYRRFPLFRKWVDSCDEYLQDEFGYQVGSVIASDPKTNGAVENILSGEGGQTSLFVLQLAIVELLRDWGIRSTAVLGHSMGEYAASVAAGVMRWQDALQLTAARAQHIAKLQSEGAMTAVFASVDAVERIIRESGSPLSVAAIDGPDHVVVSGPSKAIAALQKTLRERGTETRSLRIQQAFHSALIEPALDTIGTVVGGFELRRPNQTYISTLTGNFADEQLLSSEYWMDHSRQPVQFVSAIENIATSSIDVALEIGPHATLCTLAQLNGDSRVRFLPTLDRKRDAWPSMLTTVGQLFAQGAEIDWLRFDQVDRNHRKPRTVLPGHPLDRRPFWIDSPAEAQANDVDARDERMPSGCEAVTSAAVIAKIEDGREDRTSEMDAKRLHEAVDSIPELDRLVALWMRRALAKLKIGVSVGETLVPERLVASGRVSPQHERYLARICEVLSEEGWLRLIEDPDEERRGWSVVHPLTDGTQEIDHALRSTSLRHPVARHELQLARRCGDALADVLNGQLDPLSVLFPDGDTSDLERLYRDSAMAKCSNQLVARTASAAVTAMQARVGGRPLRVLEIGAGTGGTTTFVLPAIRDQIDSYVLTDASPLLVANAIGRFGKQTTCEVLDIESPASDQGFENRSFDLVLAANVLHATCDLRNSLANVKSLLRPGGFLLALEGVRRERLLDLIFGQAVGWWRFSDASLRVDYPLISKANWISLLHSCQFDRPVSVPFGHAAKAASESQVVLLAGVGEVPEESGVLDSGGPVGDVNRPEPIAPSRLDAALRDWIDRFHDAREGEKRPLLEGYLRICVSSVLGYDPKELDLQQPVSNLGVDSLMAIQLKNRLDRDLGISLPMVVFLQGKTIEQLIDVAINESNASVEPVRNEVENDQFPEVRSLPTELLDRQTEIAKRLTDSGVEIENSVSAESSVLAPRFPATASEKERVLGPMSVGQLALWMIHRRAPNGSAYNFAFAARTASSIDLAAMKKACQSLVKRHPVLRTRYRLAGAVAARLLSDVVEVEIDERDCTDWKHAAIVDLIRTEADRPFDLENGPVIRFSLLRCRGGDVLSIAMHHIAADLWSMDVLIQELIDLYAMIVGGGSIELGPLPTTYDAYVDWERGLDQSDEGERLWEFWRGKLEGAPHILRLPTTNPRPPEQTFQGNSIEWSVPVEIVDGLREIAHAERVTMFTIVLAAYQVWLARVCSQDDLLVGTVSASRGRSEWEGIVGYFLNHLVLRTTIVGSPTYRDVLRDSQREVLDALENQEFPFAKLVERIRPKRDPSRSPLVQTMFIWDKPRHLKESHFAPGKSSDRLRLKPILMEQRGAPFDLTLIVFELEDELRLTFRYNSDLFSADAVDTFAASLQTLIETIANDPDTPVRTASLLPSGQEGLVAKWNSTDSPFDAEQSGPSLFNKWVEKTPDAIAIETSDDQISYREANEGASRVAAQLKREGVRSGDVVALYADRGIGAILGIFGIWKAGAAYLPLDPAHPASRIQSILEDAKPRAVLASGDEDGLSSLAVNCPRLNLQECLDQDSHAALETDRRTSLQPTVDPDAVAYVIYTSGSTGRPKGVVLAHRGLANLAAAQRQVFGIRSRDRCLQFASLSFDASVFEIMLAFHCGASLQIIESSVLRSTTTAIVDRLRKARVSVATLPPSVLAALPAEDLPDLRLLIAAGEACPASMVSKWADGREMFNAYGPTETTVWATTEKCVRNGQPPTLGRPIPNFHAYVVDDNLQGTPVGVPGELCLSGPGLALEYHNLAAMTSEVFVPNPFDDRFDATMYRTGDRVRWTHDGKLEFLGRLDDQIKIDGHRIEPAEVAAVVASLEGVENAFVMSRVSGSLPELCAYAISNHSRYTGSDAEVKLRQELQENLPCYMVPKAIHLVDKFPLTVNGKVDVKRLEELSDAMERRQCDRIVARTNTQIALVDIWSEVLRTESIRIDDNFFDIGGASLQALQAADLCSKRGYNVSAETLFRHQTIAELAAEIDKEQAALSSSSSDNEVPEIAERPDGAAVPTESPTASDAEYHDAETQKSASRNQTAGVSDSNHEVTKTVLDRQLRMVVESIGTYLPPREVSTEEIVEGCQRALDFPLQRMTGIASRRVAGESEFSIDIARKAALDCLEHSRYRAEEIDLLIACNISRYDGPDFQISYEPSTASKLKHEIEANSAIAFDICNACAGFFTALSIAETELLAGRVRRAMIVSGEYITHLTKTAQAEIDGFLDPRLACLTLGDAGAATIVELTDDGSGFETLDLYTAGSHHGLCVAKASDQPHGGAIMLTDAIKASAVTLEHSVSHAHRVLLSHQWAPTDVRHLIMHQTSATTLDGAVEELNRFFGKAVCSAENTINNLTHRGNTASTTHWIAVMDAIRSGRIRSGDKALFAVSGSGQTIGTALYTFDQLPSRRIRDKAVDHHPRIERESRMVAVQPVALFGVQIAGATFSTRSRASGTRAGRLEVVDQAARATRDCLRELNWSCDEVEMLIHTGVYRDQYMSEPAVAAILAGEISMHSEGPGTDGKGILAFDLSDSGRGAMTAVGLMAERIRQGKIAKGMVTASEIENNGPDLPQRGLEEVGSAIALERTSDPRVGLGEMIFRSYPQHSDCLKVSTILRDGSPQLRIEASVELQAAMLESICDCIANFLTQNSEEIGRYDRVLISAPLQEPYENAAATFDRVASAIGARRDQLLISDLSSEGDLLTSGLAILWRTASSKPGGCYGERWLIVSGGAGIEVACVAYDFPVGAHQP